MGLAEDLDQLVAARRGGICAVKALLASLPPDEAKALANALADPKKQGSDIGKLLRAYGHGIADSTVQRHRRGACQCPEPVADDGSG